MKTWDWHEARFTRRYRDITTAKSEKGGLHGKVWKLDDWLAACTRWQEQFLAVKSFLDLFHGGFQYHEQLVQHIDNISTGWFRIINTCEKELRISTKMEVPNQDALSSSMPTCTPNIYREIHKHKRAREEEDTKKA
jgi:hypothetical protein